MHGQNWMGAFRTGSMSVPAWVVFATLAFAPAPARSEDREAYLRNWPQWRGPQGNGVVPYGDPPLTWSEDVNLRWKVSLPGQGHATPIIWGDQVFILTAVPAADGGRAQAFTVLCLDRHTGRTLWSRVARTDTPHQDIQRSNTFASGSPVTDGEVLVASFGSFGLFVYDLDGALLWSKDFPKVEVTWGEASSPALVGDAVILLRDNNEASSIHAFDRKTGRELWKQSRDERSSWTTPFLLHREGATQVVVNGSKAVRSYDPVSGEVLWQCSGLGINVSPMVVADENTIYAMSGQRTSPMAMAVRLGGKGDLTETGAVLWKHSRGASYVSSPLLYGGNLYFFQHINALLTCLNAATGEPHYSQERLDGITTVYASPIGVNDRVYVPGREGTTLVLAKSPELKILAKNTLDDGFDASPAVVGDALFLRGRDHLYCLMEP